MSIFDRQPAPQFAAVEESRGEGLAERAGLIAATPGHPSSGSLPYYQYAAREAFAAAAAHTEQPGEVE